MILRVDTNKGKFYDAKKTREFCERMKNAAQDYCRKSVDTDDAYNNFAANEEFRGQTATGMKKFMIGSMGTMNKDISDEHLKMVMDQEALVDCFAQIVDSAPNALIDYETLEMINSDFVGFHGSFGEIAGRVESILKELDKLGADMKISFPHPDKGAVDKSFANFCGGNEGYIKECENKFLKFDAEMTDYIGKNDTKTFLGDINSKTAKAAIAFDGYDSSVMPMAPQNYKTIKTLEGKLNGQVDPVTLDGLFDNDNLYRVLHGGGYSDAAILKMNYLQKITAAGEIAAMARKHPAPYDAFGQFGADQEDAFYANIFKIKAGSPLNSMDPSEALRLMKAHPGDYEKYIVVTDKEKYNWIKQMKCCRNLSDVQIVCNIMDMQTHGCSFMPTVSMIMDAYEGREEEFFKKFGFPMKTGDELNYDLLEILFYTEEKGAAHLNYEKGLETYAQCRLQYYSLHPEEYSARYKTPLYVNGNQLDPMAYPRCLEQAQATKNAGITDAYFYGGSEGGTPDSIVNRTMHFLDNHRVLDVEFKDLGNSPSKEVLQEALNRGDRVFFEISNYELEDYYGNVLFKKGGGHQVDLIGITEDGRYELSTNGRRVFFDPKKTNGNFNRHLSYYAVSYRAPIDPPPVDDRRGQWNTDIGLNVDLSKAKV